mgnify:CR=1 FL=1
MLMYPHSELEVDVSIKDAIRLKANGVWRPSISIRDLAGKLTEQEADVFFTMHHYYSDYLAEAVKMYAGQLVFANHAFVVGRFLQKMSELHEHDVRQAKYAEQDRQNQRYFEERRQKLRHSVTKVGPEKLPKVWRKATKKDVVVGAKLLESMPEPDCREWMVTIKKVYKTVNPDAVYDNRNFISGSVNRVHPDNLWVKKKR